jgi:hypothetical protein
MIKNNCNISSGKAEHPKKKKKKLFQVRLEYELFKRVI